MKNDECCKNCGEISITCQAHDATMSSDSYFQSFTASCCKCGHKESTQYLFSGDAMEGHVIIHSCPYCGTPWDKHSF